MGGPRGYFEGPGGSGRSWGGSEGSRRRTEDVPGRFLRGPGEPSEEIIFFLLGV